MRYSLHYLIMADHAMLQKILYTDIKDFGLSIGQPKVLDFLRENDGTVQKNIARGCHIEPASLSTILTGMEKKGLIRRQTCEENRRNISVYMTGQGKTVCNKIENIFTEIEKKALSGFTEDEQKELLSYLTRIHDNLEVREQ